MLEDLERCDEGVPDPRERVVAPFPSNNRRRLKYAPARATICAAVKDTNTDVEITHEIVDSDACVKVGHGEAFPYDEP